MKALILIDSFKGSLSSKELGRITKQELKKKNIESDYFPISDGGEGFLESIQSFKRIEKINITSFDPLFREIDTYYLYDKLEGVSYIELANVSGITLLTKEELNPLIASTFGLGILIKDAIRRGSKKIVIGIGGSATNDGGSGMLEAMGVKFYSSQGIIHHINNEKLKLIDHIELDEFNGLIKGVEVIVESDVTNPLLGPKGATYIFSPQKGATPSQLVLLEENMQHFANISACALSNDYSNNNGSGAAGGVGFALIGYLKAKANSGIDFILDEIKKNDLSSYDTIISGEGKIDSQSLYGKVISGVIKRFIDKKIILVCAINELNESNLNIYSICPNITNKETSKKHPKKYYRYLIRSIFTNVKGMIFDLDGTILNTIDDLTNSINYSIKELNVSKVKVSDAKYLVGSGINNIIIRLIKLKNLDPNLYDYLYERYQDYYSKNNKVCTRPYEGVCELLNELKKRGIKIAVFSNKPHKDTLDVINYYFPNTFDIVIGKIDGVELKPSKMGAIPILEYFNTDINNIIYVGDTIVDMETSNNIGTKSIGALWGFRTKEELVKGGANVLAKKPLDILKIIGE